MLISFSSFLDLKVGYYKPDGASLGMSDGGQNKTEGFTLILFSIHTSVPSLLDLIVNSPMEN